jgi:elongation factor Ts
MREATGLGMMECKKALVEAKGDFKAAEEQLRIKSGAKASKAASRVTAEGMVSAFIAPDGKAGAVAEVNCETDFVAKNDDFVASQKCRRDGGEEQPGRHRSIVRHGSSTVPPAWKRPARRW